MEALDVLIAQSQFNIPPTQLAGLASTGFGAHLLKTENGDSPFANQCVYTFCNKVFLTFSQCFTTCVTKAVIYKHLSV